MTLIQHHCSNDYRAGGKANETDSVEGECQRRRRGVMRGRRGDCRRDGVSEKHREDESGRERDGGKC